MPFPKPHLRRNGSAVILLIGGLAWGIALFGVLQLHRVEGLPVHSICGVWGCGPPTGALLAYHGFWTVLLCPPAAYFGFTRPTDHAKKLALGLLTAGGIAILGILGWAAIDWLMSTNPSSWGYVVQRAFFVLATMVDLPAVQIAASGIACQTAAWAAGRLANRRRAGQTLSDHPSLPDATVAENPVSP